MQRLFRFFSRLRVVSHLSSGIVEQANASARENHPTRENVTRDGEREIFHFSLSPSRLAFLAWGDFHARSRFACSTIPEEKWGTTRSLFLQQNDYSFLKPRGCVGETTNHSPMSYGVPKGQGVLTMSKFVKV